MRPEAETELTRYTHAGVQHEVHTFSLSSHPGFCGSQNPAGCAAWKALFLLGPVMCSVSLQGSFRVMLSGVACPQVEAGLDDLRAAYAELHQQLDSGGKPPEEKERIAQHVSPNPSSSSSVPRHHRKPSLLRLMGLQDVSAQVMQVRQDPACLVPFCKVAC